MRQVTQYLFTLKGTVSLCVLQILFFPWTGVINRDCINLRQSLHCKDVAWNGIQLVRCLLSAFKQFDHLSHLPFPLHPKIHEHKRPAISLIIKALLWNYCGREWNTGTDIVVWRRRGLEQHCWLAVDGEIMNSLTPWSRACMTIFQNVRWGVLWLAPCLRWICCSWKKKVGS